MSKEEIQNKRGLLNVKNDYVFKYIFGRQEDDYITKSFLNAVLKNDISDVNLDKNTVLEKDLTDSKFGILDINATINGNTKCDIEVQVVDEKNIEHRIPFYWAKLYAKGLKSGQNYNELKRTVVIAILGFNMEKLKNIPKFHTKWNIREEG